MVTEYECDKVQLFSDRVDKQTRICKEERRNILEMLREGEVNGLVLVVQSKVNELIVE